MSGAPLSEWILGTERPLSYLREADPDQRMRTRLPVSSWLEKIAGVEDPPAEVVELGELFRRLDDAAGRRDNEVIDRALALVRKLGGGAVGAAPPVPEKGKRRAKRAVDSAPAGAAGGAGTPAASGARPSGPAESRGGAVVQLSLIHI